MSHTRARALLIAFGTVAAAGPLAPPSRGDSVVLKNGIVYRGTVDRDNTILWVYDGLKRVVLRDSKVARIEPDAALRNLEAFRIEQPLTVHGGSMPKEVLNVEASPWNDRGRRMFSYANARGKVPRFEQAISELGPYLSKVRGVDGYWQGPLATSEIPRETVLGILGKVERTDRNERIRVARFLIQAGWYPEARAELDRILKDFPDEPDLRERVAGARASVVQLEAEQTRGEIDRARGARQPRRAASLIRSFPSKDVSAELVAQVAELGRAEDARAAADKALADGLTALAGTLSKARREPWEPRLLEILDALTQAPDAVRDRLVAWQKARAEGGKSPEAEFALAMSGFVVGSDAAVEDLDGAMTLWTTRDQVRRYLGSRDGGQREEILAKLEGASLPGDPAGTTAVKKLDTVTRLARLMPPPLHEAPASGAASAKGPVRHRVRDDANAEPTEYLVTLPPEYHPLRSYPTVVALHDGTGPQAAVAWWSDEAARHGYIVVAPEYRLSPEAKEYQYSESEHAAVELALRDARRRYAVDSDRVFLGGQLVGANMAWDFGLAHPDEFAGVAVISGLPFKYVNRYLPHAEKLPLYVALGDLAPAGNEVVFGQMLKPLIARAWDVTYLEYMKRGLEDFPEEAPAVLDWMDRRSRDPYPKTFEALTARESDNRFYGVVVRELSPGRATAPGAVEPFGKNLSPASIKVRSSALSNLLNVQTTGVRKLDVWLSPRLIDFSKRVEVRLNTRSLKGVPKLDLEPLLEDLRIRGDRQQVYWMKVPVG